MPSPLHQDEAKDAVSTLAKIKPNGDLSPKIFASPADLKNQGNFTEYGLLERFLAIL
jgi:hypothetical protein